MRRREVIAGLAAAGAWPHAASAQQTPLIGLLSSRSPDESRNLLSAFRRGLGESGYVEGQNVRVEYRFGLGQYDAMVALARELASRPLAVLISVGGDPAALAARAVEVTTPVVSIFGTDPVELGLVASPARRKHHRVQQPDPIFGAEAPRPLAGTCPGGEHGRRSVEFR
jgi:putative ABC transport system substrate-binding protein